MVGMSSHTRRTLEGVITYNLSFLGIQFAQHCSARLSLARHSAMPRAGASRPASQRRTTTTCRLRILLHLYRLARTANTTTHVVHATTPGSAVA